MIHQTSKYRGHAAVDDKDDNEDDDCDDGNCGNDDHINNGGDSDSQQKPGLYRQDVLDDDNC